jgi:tRNA1(Val) A37 N6-methylase TrmN6
MYNLNFFIYKILRVISIFFEVLKGVDFKRNIRKSKSKVLQKYYNYEHTIEEDLVNVLNDLKISKNDKILDIGCGKGYALYLMHQFNFKNIDGIELSKKLSDIAKKNFIIIKKKTNIYNINATKFKYYENYNFFYMFNPFNRSIMEIVLNKIIKKINKKKIYIIYNNPTCHLILNKNFFLIKKYNDKWNNGIYLYSNKLTEKN